MYAQFLHSLTMLSSFLYPYLHLLDGAVWTLEQSLDGLGISPSSVVQYVLPGHRSGLFDAPFEGVLLFSGAATVIALLLWLLVVVTGYVLARKTGAFIALLVTAIPGALNMMSLWPAMTLRPDTYVDGGGGVMGTGWGMAVLVFAGAVAGWCLTLVLVDLCRPKEAFWHIYDHVWSVAGLLAAIFFVADTQVNFHAQRLERVSHTAQAASAYLARQAATYAQWCRTNGGINTASCHWASVVQQRLLDYATEDKKIFQEFGPQVSAEIYASPGRDATPEEIDAIRTEIAAYNATVCPIIDLGGGVSRPVGSPLLCLRTPPDFEQAFPDPFHGRVHKDWFQMPVAVDVEGIAPTLIRLREQQVDLQAKVDADMRSRYARWLYFLFFSAVLGGKVAGSTAKLVRLDKREPKETRRTIYLTGRVARISFRCIAALLRTAWWLCFRLPRIVLARTRAN